MVYKGQLWSDELPSDPEIIAALFCHILDDAYYYNKNQKDVLKNPSGHLLDHTQAS
jgi:hypothetical protein